MTKKIILISGGSDGLGKALATKFSPNHQVIILSHNEEKLKQVSVEINCDYVGSDVTDYPSLEKAIGQVIEKYQRIDVLINCAGVWTEGPLEQADPQQIKDVVLVNTLGTIFLTKLVIPTMKTQGGGRIINIISQDGLHAKKDHSVYSASKWAITGFTKCLQIDLSSQKIGVTGLYPGLMKTSLFEKQGVVRDLSHSLELSEVCSLVEFVINLPSETLLPEIGIKNINNPTNMDDSGTPSIGLDINPDMITTQTGVPTTTPPVSPPAATPIPRELIDITPGVVSAPTHPSPVTDITPAFPTPVSTPGIKLPVDQGVIDITPGEKVTPVIQEQPGSTHLADLLPQPEKTPEPVPVPDLPGATTTPNVDLIQTPIVTPVIENTESLPKIDPVVETVSPPVLPTVDTSTAVEPAVTPPSPLYEDPNLVKLAK